MRAVLARVDARGNVHRRAQRHWACGMSHRGAPPYSKGTLGLFRVRAEGKARARGPGGRGHCWVTEV
jgi:hypothetical protein